MTMTKQTRPKLSRPKADVIQEALFAGCWSEGESLLRCLWLAQRKAEGSDALTRSYEAYLYCAGEAATLLHDYIALLALPGHLAAVIDCIIRRDDKYAPLREQAMALVAGAGCGEPKGEAA